MLDTLYYKDNYLKEFNTKVVNCIEKDNKILVELENTAFYPEGGGQPADIGMIDGVKVVDVQEKDNKIYHEVEEKIEIGKNVNCKIDFEKRFSNMQHHTAEHIVSGIICKKYNTVNVGFHMGKDFVTMDFNIDLSKKKLEEIENIANEAVFKNIEIIEKIVTEEEALQIEYRSKKRISGNIRLIEIPGYDLCACCGIHVKRTGEIGIIKLLSAEKYKSGIRIYMICGKKALKNYGAEYDELSKLSVLLSSKHNEIYNSVVALKNEIKELKIKNSKLKNKIFENEAQQIEKQDINIIFKEDLDSNEIKSFCQLINEKSNKIAAVFSKDKQMYKYMIMSENYNTTEISKAFNENLNGRGGGKPNMVQGQVAGTEEQIRKIFEKIVL